MAQLQSTLRLAEPILASSLITEEDIDALIGKVLKGQIDSRKETEGISTGIPSVDDALGGGLRKGAVVGVSGSPGAGASDLCLSFLAAFLLSTTTDAAAIVDTTGNLDVFRIYALLLSRLQHDAEIRKAQAVAQRRSDAPAEDVAAKILDRVKIMRVFDLIGVMETISEIRGGLEQSGNEDKQTKNKEQHDRKAEKEEKKEVEPKTLSKTVIADSEDEDDEMLYDTSGPTDEPPLPPSKETETGPSEPPAPPEPEQKPHEQTEANISQRISFVLIDNLAHVVSPILKKDHVHANTLSHAVLRSLVNLTHKDSLHTLLLNPTSFPTANPKPEKDVPYGAPRGPDHPPPPPPSIFSSNKAVPALGGILAPYLDAHLLVSQVPKKKVDARVLASHGDVASGLVAGAGAARKGLRGVEMACVVEVLADRWEGRVGDWGAFCVDESGLQGL